MCSGPMVCHGDKHLFADYTEEQRQLIAKDDCKAATYFITSDGRYAIDSDFVDLDKIDLLDEKAISLLPKIKLK